VVCGTTGCIDRDGESVGFPDVILGLWLRPTVGLPDGSVDGM